MSFPDKSSFIQALLEKTNIPFGIHPDSVADIRLSLSTDLKIRKIIHLSRSLYGHLQNNTMKEKIAAVTRGEYRLIGDDFTLKYFAQTHCLVVKGDFSTEKYAMYLQKNSVYTAFLNRVIANLTNQHLLEPVINKQVICDKDSSFIYIFYELLQPTCSVILWSCMIIGEYCCSN